MAFETCPGCNGSGFQNSEFSPCLICGGGGIIMPRIFEDQPKPKEKKSKGLFCVDERRMVEE